MAAWIVRVGRVGEREGWALENNVAGGGFREVGDLSSATSRDQVKEAVKAGYPSASVGRQNNFAGQLWALRGAIQPGDVVVMPLKTTKKIALGFCTRGYKYLSQEEDPSRRHTIGVDWKRSDVSRAAVKDDLLNTLNGAMTIFQASKNNAEVRLTKMLDTGIDPGGLSASDAAVAGAQGPSAPIDTTADDGSDVADPNPAPTLEAIRDRVRTHLVENFGQHKLTGLIADILEVQGYVCDVSPEGPDGGVDIMAGSGPLGLDSPTLIVECKSEASPIGSRVVRGLNGAIGTTHADQGLLVAWGGLNKGGQDELRANRLKIRLWDSEKVLDQLFAVYELLPADTRARLPLKRAWVLDEETG
ncbi:restriction endonuclease [Segeticoccus rhizosphaerae]|uniref:restriction endonuclease n=1 Tax=Segeticoccus rhizosphaerae TaxID=1104777 RepID=UPI001264FBA1|nr:restriction endonuclease [Segeticoccus rhizosphaerae]